MFDVQNDEISPEIIEKVSYIIATSMAEGKDTYEIAAAILLHLQAK